MTPPIDFSGMSLGRLTVVSMSTKRPVGKGRYWLCKCRCGKEVIRAACHLSRMKSYGPNQGGCRRCSLAGANVANIIHDASHTRLYSIWIGMKSRCGNKKNTKYKIYGGKGITVCSEWAEFVNFRRWAMASGYSDDLTIERVNPDWHYDPSNCEWITHRENSRRGLHPGEYWRSMTCNA